MKRKFLSILIPAFLLSACSTTISTRVKRPAQLDLEGARSIAVVPFQEAKRDGALVSILSILLTGSDPDKEKSETKKIADYVTDQLNSAIAEEAYFDLISSHVVEKKLRDNEKAPCDIYITGHIQGFECKVDRESHIQRNKTGDIERSYHTYSKHVDFTLVYEIIDSETGRVIQHHTDNISQTSSESEYEYALPSVYDMTTGQVSGSIRGFIKKIQPYYENISYTLLKDKEKNPDMKTALKLAKNGSLDSAQRIFLDIYETESIWEAGYNAALIYQAKAEYDKAEQLMEGVADKSRNEKAYAALSSIKADIRSQEKLKEQLAE